MEIQLQSSIITHFLKMSSYYGSAKLTSGSEEEDYYFLQPMFEKLPPNEIISQRYAPDVVTQVKLMYAYHHSRAKDERKNNVHFVPPKTKNTELQNYAQLFNVFDYLGYSYLTHINQTVYFKFNNAKHNLMPEAKLKTRVLPAFYVPFQQIYSQQESFFSKNIGLSFPETCANCYLPTAKDNRGCSFDPIFCSNYESGNLFAAIRKCPFQYDLILQNDINSCDSVSWFNFSVQFLQQGYYSFRIVNITADMSKNFEKGMKIAYTFLNPLVGKALKKGGEGWSLCGENIKFTKSPLERENKKGEYYYQLYFEFKCKNKHDIIMFALDVPYSSLENQMFFNKILFKKVKTMLKVEKHQYGKTISGSPLIAYHITRKKLRGESIQITPMASESLLKEKRRSINLSPINHALIPEHNNRSIVILGRMGGSDVNGSFIIQGMVDYLMDSIQFESMKRVFDFYFVPLANIDGVRYGNTIANLTGSILNNNWRTPSRHYQPEVYNLKEFLQELNKETPISLIINLTTEKEDIYSSVMGVINDHEEVEDTRIFPFILSKRNKLFSFQKSIFFRKNQNSSMCCVLNQLFAKALIYQMKISHFETIRKNDQSTSHSQLLQTDIKQCTPDGYRMLGKQLISNYLEHVKLYDKNLLLRDKWLKEIEELQQSIQKKPNSFIEDLRVEDKFPQSFYDIESLRKVAEVKSAKSLISCKLLNPPKTFDIDRAAKDIKRKEKLIKNTVPRSVNDFISKRNQTEGYLKTKLQMSQESKSIEPEELNADKPISLFRIGEKKTSILLNCPSNTLNLEVEGESKANSKNRRQKSAIEKEILKKELSTKMLRKVKIEDTVKGWKGKQRVSDVKLGDFLINS